MTAIAGLLGLFLGSLLVGKPFFNDTNYRKALQSQSAEEVIQSVNNSPIDSTRMLMAAETLANSGLYPQAEELVDKVIEINPRVFNAWDLKLRLLRLDSRDTSIVISKMNELNPRIQTKE